MHWTNVGIAVVVVDITESMKKTDETIEMPGLVLTNCSAGLIVWAVVWTAPETMPSA